MANEVTVKLEINVSKSGAESSRKENFKATMGGNGITHSIQNVGTSVEPLDIGSDAIAVHGWYYIKNLDTVNYIRAGLSGQYTMKLLPGESCIFRAAAPIYAIANSSACDVEYLIIEE